MNLAQTFEGPSLAVNNESRTLSVTASGRAEAEPDIADLNVGFVVYAQTLEAAYKSATKTSNAIVEAMLGAGAAKNEIQSRAQRVFYLNDFEMKQHKGMRFRVTQAWTVSVVPKDAALVLHAAVNAGANQSGDIAWRVKSDIALDAEAIRKATDRARANAVALAESMSVTLGKPLFATNNGGIGAQIFAAAGAPRGFTADQALAIETQRVKRDASVRIIFAIE